MEKEKITVNTVVDDVVGGMLTGTGVVAASVAMKYANGKVNPWVVSLIALGMGIGGRVASNFVSNKKVKEGIKDVANGFTAAGALDLTVKAVKEFAPNLLTALPTEVQSAIPSLSGDREQVFRIPGLYGTESDLLRGLNNSFQEAEVVGSSLLS